MASGRRFRSSAVDCKPVGELHCLALRAVSTPASNPLLALGSPLFIRQVALRRLGVDLTTTELDGILRIFDADGSGSIVAWADKRRCKEAGPFSQFCLSLAWQPRTSQSSITCSLDEHLYPACTEVSVQCCQMHHLFHIRHSLESGFVFRVPSGSSLRRLCFHKTSHFSCSGLQLRCADSGSAWRGPA